jgi:hypothetical protein
MKERPILFSGPMVRAILDGRKTQTRRVVNPQPTHRMIEGLAHVTRGMDPSDDGAVWYDGDCIGPGREVRAPWSVDDVLWVRERWTAPREFDRCPPRLIPKDARFLYGADGYTGSLRLRPSIHMPRWACRLTLRVESVRVERLHDISEEDAIAEGFVADIPPDPLRGGTAADWFAETWQNINWKKHPWDSNPWVWVVTFAKESTP